MNVKDVYVKTQKPVKILQFGEGNFLRAFVDYVISEMNKKDLLDSKVCVVQPLENGLVKMLEDQNGLYTLFLEGISNGEIKRSSEIIDVVDDFINPYTQYDKFLDYATSEDLQIIFSNTTEAGIVLVENDLDFDVTPKSYPSKLLSFLYKRYIHFKGDYDKGLFIIPCELIDDNGDNLKEILVKLASLKGLDDNFISWLKEANNFYNTLVDRIVPGYPRDNAKELEKELGYTDNLMVKAEIFLFWVIKGNEKIKKVFPADKANIGVHFVDDIKPYKERKVKILNGSHTLMVPVAYLSGIDTVRESMEDEVIGSFVKEFIFNEVIPTIKLPHEQMVDFSNSVLDRYKNPFIRHELLSIALNSFTKFKTRILSTILDNFNLGLFPKNSLFSLAALIYFFKGKRGNDVINIKDDEKTIVFFNELWSNEPSSLDDFKNIAFKVLSYEEHFEVDLTKYDNVLDFVSKSLFDIHTLGMKEAVKKI